MAPKFSRAGLLSLGLHSLSVLAAPATSASSAWTAATQTCTSTLDGTPPSPTPPNWTFSGTVRKYYVAAEEVDWDYAPTGWDNWLGVPMNVSPRAQYAGTEKYGTKWLKALYRGYTDGNFTTYTEQPPWQGTQGPTIRAEVGDLIEILFVNKLTNYYATMHSMGLMYTKYNGEGAAYANNTVPGANVTLTPSNAVPPINSGVAPGDCTVYKWMVGTADGPASGGYPAQVHSYHSYVAMQQDTNAGLIGPTIVYAQGMMSSTMSNYREIPLLYMAYDENDSWLSGTNQLRLQSNSSSQSGGFASISSAEIDNLWSGNQSVWRPQLVNLAGSRQFSNAPSFYSMNGYIFANNPTYEMCLDDKVIWYVNAYGSASHVFHMHGNGFTFPSDGVNTYATGLPDGIGKTLYMNSTGTGKWQVICHVNNHHTMGMVSNYEVYQAGQCPLPALDS